MGVEINFKMWLLFKFSWFLFLIICFLNGIWVKFFKNWIVIFVLIIVICGVSLIMFLVKLLWLGLVWLIIK